MEMKTKNNRVDLMTVQEYVDEVVFNYIDTSNNYQQAYKALSPKLDEGLQYLQTYLTDNQVDVPPSNTYWTLYATLVSKLAYFKAFSMWKLNHGQPEEMNRLFIASAYVLPNKDTEINDEILADISNHYKAFQQDQKHEKIINLHEEVLYKKMTTDECLRYIKQHLL